MNFFLTGTRESGAGRPDLAGSDRPESARPGPAATALESRLEKNSYLRPRAGCRRAVFGFGSVKDWARTCCEGFCCFARETVLSAVFKS